MIAQRTNSKRTVAWLSVIVLVLAIVVTVKLTTYEPRPAVWHDLPGGLNGDGSQEVAVTVEQGWKDDIGLRIIGDLWVKYNFVKLHATFTCATGGPATDYLGVAIQSTAGNGAAIVNPNGSCP